MKKTNRKNLKKESDNKSEVILCTVHGAPGVFSQDQFFQRVIRVSIYLLVFRLGYTFLFALLMGESWHVRYAWGWLPIMGFNSAPEVFAQLNSYAVLAMAATEFLIFVIVLFRKRKDIQYEFWAWYMGIMMTVIQYAALVWLSSEVQFGIRGDLWMPLGGFALIASLLVFFFKNRVYEHAEAGQKYDRV